MAGAEMVYYESSTAKVTSTRAVLEGKTFELASVIQVSMETIYPSTDDDRDNTEFWFLLGVLTVSCWLTRVVICGVTQPIGVESLYLCLVLAPLVRGICLYLKLVAKEKKEKKIWPLYRLHICYPYSSEEHEEMDVVYIAPEPAMESYNPKQVEEIAEAISKAIVATRTYTGYHSTVWTIQKKSDDVLEL